MDVLYAHQKEKRRWYNEGIEAYSQLLERVNDILHHINFCKDKGTICNYIIITINNQRTRAWVWKDRSVLQMDYKKLLPKEQECFETLLKKYFNIEKLTDYRWRITLK